MYGECMARLISTTVRLDEEDVRALRRARAAGHSASALIRKGLRVVASRYYAGRRPPSTRLFESTDNKLGDESELFRDYRPTSFAPSSSTPDSRRSSWASLTEQSPRSRNDGTSTGY
jgi:hypothetical protein